MTVLDARHAKGYDGSLFWDGTVHLDRLGAVALSDDVAAVLRRYFDGEALGGWVRLPAYRERAGSAGLEDVDQSATALRSRDGLTR